VFKRLKVSHAILLIAAVPMLAALFFAAAEVRGLRDRAAELERAAAVVELAGALSAAVHEQQKERGLSSGFIASDGAELREALTAQRALTDEAHAALGRVVPAQGALAAELAPILGRLSTLAELRDRIDALATPRAEAVAWYTELNGDMLGVAAQRVRDGVTAPLAADLAAYVEFLAAKDLAGLERAVGAAGFAAGAFGPELRDRMTALDAAQRASFRAFRRLARAERLSAFEALTTAAPWLEAAALRRAGLDGAAQAEAISPATWFEAATRRIETMKRFEDRLRDALAATLGALRAEADAAATRALAVAVAALSLAAALCVVAVLGVSRAFRKLIEAMSALAAGRLDADLPEPGAGEFGRAGAALRVFRDAATERRRMEAEAAERAAASARRAEAMEALGVSLRAAVEAAERGDLTVRVEARSGERDLDAIGAGVNQLLERVAHGLEETGRVLGRLAEGDLGDRARGEFDGAFRKLQGDVNGALDRLSDLMRSIASVGEEIEASSGEIARGANDTARQAEQQAVGLEQTAAAMEEMSSNVRANAANTGRASRLAAEAAAKAAQGRDVAAGAGDAMTAIQRSADRIVEIVSMIDSIAFTTNLLALNASVEAARAGEAGKGFAVVASEVRGLAGRSAAAAKDIRALVETAAEQVAGGVARISDTRAALTSIGESVEAASGSIREIEQATQEQAAGADEVAAAVSRMDQATQANAAAAEQGAAGAASLNQQAARLRGLIGGFRNVGGPTASRLAAE
jgi:methyl-accepting chemotaxis protein